MSSLYDFIGQWGLFEGPGIVTPDDVKIWQLLHGKILYCRGVKDDELILTYRDVVIRGKPGTFKTIPPPDFYRGDGVTIKQSPRKTARIREVNWHWDREEPMFWLYVDGKQVRRHYFKEELQRKD